MATTLQIDTDRLVSLMQRDNLAQAEIIARLLVTKEPNNPIAFNALGVIAQAINLPGFALGYYEAAARISPDWDVPRVSLSNLREHLGQLGAEETGAAHAVRQHASEYNNCNSREFLLIKAWGYGFWADIDHVLGQLLIAEMTNRIPVVYWGSNSLYCGEIGHNAFDYYFEPVSDFNIEDLMNENYDYFPPKWTHLNLRQNNVSKWQGVGARMAGLYYLNRPEKVVVSDFYTPIANISPWIQENSHLYGLSIDELYRNIIRRYLRPKNVIMEKVEDFYRKHLSSSNFISVHIRGSDKVIEIKKLDQLNQSCHDAIAKCLSRFGNHRIFLMTDDARILSSYRQRYGDLIVTTDCHRTCDETGVHHLKVADKYRLGIEIMVDTYLAVKGAAFIGNGYSNPSRMVYLLREWADDEISLYGGKMHHSIISTFNLYNLVVPA